MALVLEPFADTELVLGGAEEAGLLPGVLLALERKCQWAVTKTQECTGSTYVVQAKQDLALSGGRGRQRSDPTDLGEGSAGRGALSEQRAGRAGEVDGGTSKYHCE